MEYKYSVNQKVKISWDFGEEYRLAAELQPRANIVHIFFFFFLVLRI